MTEGEWLTATDPEPMLAFLPGKMSERKIRLLACACCRTYPADQFIDFLDALDALEKLADKCISFEEARRWRERMVQIKEHNVMEQDFVKAAVARTVQYSFERDGSIPDHCYTGRDAPEDRKESARTFCTLVRDISNLFHTDTLDPSWLTSTVLALATGIYEEKAFDRMPILADALQDAGCDNDDILSHCRQPGVHVKGCWVVDLILSKC
jgi:hypothetical protein